MTDPSNATRRTAAAGDGEVVPETQAKQGRRGYHVLAVMLVSLVLVVAVFGVIFATHAHTPSDASPAATQANNRTLNNSTNR